MVQNIKYNWQDETGFLFQRNIYDSIIRNTKKDFLLIEIGPCQKSTYYLTSKIKLSRKNINVTILDKKHSEDCYKKLISCADPNLFNLIKLDHKIYINRVENKSVDCVYVNNCIDSFELVEMWKEKIKPGGFIAGNFFNFNKKLKKFNPEVNDLNWRIIFN